MEIPAGFGDRLRKLRRAKGLSAVQLGKMLGVSDVAVLKYENEKMKPSLGNIQGLATALETTVDFLIYGHASSVKKDNIDYTYDMVRKIVHGESDLEDLQKLLLDFLAARVEFKQKRK